MHEDFLHLFFLFQVSLFLSHASMSFLPILGALLVTLGHIHDTLKLFNTTTHARVQLLLHRMQVVAHVLAESHKECQRLVNWLALQVNVGSQLERDHTIAQQCHLLIC